MHWGPGILEMRWFVGAAAAVLTWSAVVPVHGQETAPSEDSEVDGEVNAEEGGEEDARALFEAGRIAYAAARWEEALRNFEHAYELAPYNELLFNIGLSHERVGNDQAALDVFERYLEQTPEGTHREEVLRRAAALRETIARATAASGYYASGSSPDEGGESPTPWIVLGTGGVLAIAGAVLLAVGIADRQAVRGSADGELEWTDAEARLSRADALSVAGGIGLGIGVALMATSLFLFESDEGVTVSLRGPVLLVGGRL